LGFAAKGMSVLYAGLVHTDGDSAELVAEPTYILFCLLYNGWKTFKWDLMKVHCQRTISISAFSVFRSLIFISFLNRDLACHFYPSHGGC
jgi:hypothetical protein